LGYIESFVDILVGQDAELEKGSLNI